MQFKKLFEPGQIGTMTVKNRIVMAPMVSNFADPNGGVTDRVIEHYRAKAKGGTGLIIVEACTVPKYRKVLSPPLNYSFTMMLIFLVIMKSLKPSMIGEVKQRSRYFIVGFRLNLKTIVVISRLDRLGRTVPFAQC